MLYLRTGGNGSCKTLFTLEDVRKLQLETNRPVCVNDRFKIYPHILEEFGWRVIDFKDWRDQPDGTIFMIDESQKDLPVRPNSATVPPHILELAEHRVRGFDFFFLTPHPMLIDSFVRKLVQPPGWHQHLKRRWGASDTTTVIQFDAVRADCEKAGSGKDAQSWARKQPKHVYAWYESAFIHTGKVKIPKQVYVGIACVIGMVVLIAAAYLRLKPADKTAEKPPEAPTAQHAPAQPGQIQQPQQGASGHVQTTAELVTSYQPRIEGMPQTAPRYDSLTTPTTAPYPAACVHMKPRCQCYSQQGTKLEVPKDVCLQIVEKGFFLDWQAGPTNAAQPVNHSLEPKGQPQQVAAAAESPVAIGMQAGTKAVR